MMTLQQKEQFILLRAQDWSLDKIAKKMKISKSTLVSMGKDLSLQIDNAKSLQLDNLREKFCLTKEMKLEIYRENIDRIKGEITLRSLEKVSTDKLYEMLDRYIELIEKEKPTISFQEKVKTDYDLSELLDYKTDKWDL